MHQRYGHHWFHIDTAAPLEPSSWRHMDSLVLLQHQFTGLLAWNSTSAMLNRGSIFKSSGKLLQWRHQSFETVCQLFLGLWNWSKTMFAGPCCFYFYFPTKPLCLISARWTLSAPYGTPTVESSKSIYLFFLLVLDHPLPYDQTILHDTLTNRASSTLPMYWYE